MRYRLLGRSGLLVSEICLGTMTYGGKGRWQPIGQLGLADVEGQIKTAFEVGVNFIDTADVYSEGDSETLLGQALKNLKLPREELVIATKVRIRMGAGPNQVGLSRGHIMDGVNASLRRLQLDHIDLYQIHGQDLATPMEETLRRSNAANGERPWRVRCTHCAGLAAAPTGGRKRDCRREDEAAARRQYRRNGPAVIRA